MLKALIFDFDGTLVDTEELQYEAFKRTIEKHNIKFVSFEEFTNIYTGTGSKFIISSEFDKHNIDYNLEKAIHEKGKLYLELCHENGVKLINGVSDFLNKVKELGYKLAIASGSSLDDLKEVSSIAGLPEIFDAIVGAEDYENPKPDPSVFLVAAEKLGFAPEECIVFEDAMNGIEAAKNAGMKSYAIASYLPKERFLEIDPAVKVVQDFIEIEILDL